MYSNNMKIWRLALVILGIAFFTSCSNDDPEPVVHAGYILFKFEHRIDGEPVEFDQMKYTNGAGNLYEVSEIQWFISDITLNKENCSVPLLIDDSGFAHYVDTDIEESLVWAPDDTIPSANYTCIDITFGLKGEKNLPLTFVNPPESDMIWPYPMGGDNGGYHYMKLNGFWMDPLGVRQAFNFHLGVGKAMDANDNPQYIQNWFEVRLGNSDFSLEDNETKVITIIMNVDEWFKNPTDYDHNVFGSKIMNNQDAMHQGCENGENGVFTIGSIE